MANKIEVAFKIDDTRAQVRKRRFNDFEFGEKIKEVFLNDVYTIDHDFSNDDLNKIGCVLSNKVIEKFVVDEALIPKEFDFAIEVGFLPGVTDNIGHTAKETIEDLLKMTFKYGEGVYTSQITFIKGQLIEDEVKAIADSLYNPIIQRVRIKNKAQFKEDLGMNTIVPKVKLHGNIEADEINLAEMSDDELLEIGKKGVKDPKNGEFRGPLALSLNFMKLIRDYFKNVEKRNPYDIEIESVAQTWSEHCKHTIFASPMDDISEGIYKKYIKGATEKVRKDKGKEDICISVFKDNSGAIEFDDDYMITDKVETHNSPSALDPFGGAITGIVGVNRDCIGFGLGAKPILNRYGYCFADPEDKWPLYRDQKRTNKMLSPKRIMEGVVAGVNFGGNCSGIPTPCGFKYFDKRYKGKPLVFVGTVGLMPKDVDGKQGHVKKAKSGDYIVCVGGRVGQDGIHGATFSSEALDSGSPATAVQIGDPITQKKLSDAIVKEARDKHLYNSITDNGAGGISCSVSEMAKECGGFVVDLEKVPLKYPNLEPWKIWISESQERMTLSVSKEKWAEFKSLMERRSVEAVIIGEFNDTDRAIVKFNGKEIMNMDMEFLHEGLEYYPLKTEDYKVKFDEPDMPVPEKLGEVLNDMIGRLNICSYDFISYQYDHMVQGSACLLPLQGKGKVNANAYVIKPRLDSNKGVVVSQALYPNYSEIDAYHMAACSIDNAIRNAISVGGNLDHLALLDNFCWCSSQDPKRLGQLKDAAKACYDYAVSFGTPLISGKDSMFNDFKGFDRDGNPIDISVLPTLLISSIGVIEDVRKCVSMDCKFDGDLIYVIGKTKEELGGSEYFAYLGEKDGKEKFIGNKMPEVDSDLAKNIYRKMYEAIQKDLVVSCQSVDFGGIGVALAKKALAGKLGIEVNLSKIDISGDVERDDYLLFSESQSRFIVTVDPSKKEKFESVMRGLPCDLVGKVVNTNKITIRGLKGNVIVDEDLDKLNGSYRKRLSKY